MKTYVLLAAANQYEAGIGSLKCAARDARRLESLFDHKCRFETHYLEPEDLDSRAIERAIERAGKALAGGGVFIFYFAGHGKQQGEDQLMLLPGAKRNLLEQGRAMHSGVFSYQTLRAMTSGWPGVKRLFIFDSCRALLPTRGGDIQPAFEGIGVKRDPAFASKVDWEEDHDFTELNSCGPGEASLELPEDKGGPGHGVFSLALLESLNKAIENRQPLRIDQPFVTDLRNRMDTIAKKHGERLCGEPTLFGEPVVLWDNSASEETEWHDEEERQRETETETVVLKQGTPSVIGNPAARRVRWLGIAGLCCLVLLVGFVLWVKQKEKSASVMLVGEVAPSTYRDPITGMEFVFVKGGCYQMGDTFGDGNYDEYPVHKVCVGDYYLGKYEVTQQEWKSIMDSNPSKFKKGPRYPVETVKWKETQEFIERLNAKSGKRYRLPTEAEWEYAARSGTKTEKWAGTSVISDLTDYAWYGDNSRDTTHEVGTRNANKFGLYDMSGNVREWVMDWYGGGDYIGDCWIWLRNWYGSNYYYRSSPRENPQGATSGEEHVSRGGDWDGSPWGLRASYRGKEAGMRGGNLGVRLALPPDQVGK